MLFRSRAVQEFLDRFDFGPLAIRCDLGWLKADQKVLLVSGAALRGSQPDRLMIYDAALRPRLELEIDTSAGFSSTALGEAPAGGLRLLRYWGTKEFDLSAEDVRALRS